MVWDTIQVLYGVQSSGRIPSSTVEDVQNFLEIQSSTVEAIDALEDIQ